MHRYGNIDYILTLDIDDFIGIYLKAKEENAIEQCWQQWLVEFSKMDKDHFTSFENYKKEVFKPKIENNVDVKQILADAEKIKLLDQKKKVNI